MSDLYHNDALAWSERQAALLRQLAEGQRVNELIDWLNVIEEVQDVGISELKSCRSLLRLALLHLLKLQTRPRSQAASHWRSEVAGFLADARDRFSPSMRQRIDLDEIYTTALKQMQAELGARSKETVLPQQCPFSLEDLLGDELAVTDLVRRFAPAGELARSTGGG